MAGIADHQFPVRGQDVQQGVQDFFLGLGVAFELVVRAVPFAVQSDEPGLEYGYDIHVASQQRFQLFDMGQDDIGGRALLLRIHFVAEAQQRFQPVGAEYLKTVFQALELFRRNFTVFGIGDHFAIRLRHGQPVLRLGLDGGGPFSVRPFGAGRREPVFPAEAALWIGQPEAAAGVTGTDAAVFDGRGFPVESQGKGGGEQG